VFGLTQLAPHKISGLVQVGSTHWLLLQTLPPVHWPSLQHSKQPSAGQQLLPPGHCALKAQLPLEQLLVVQGSPSLQSVALQHSWHDAPQSFGVPAAH
jgi:hypothetical protein